MSLKKLPEYLTALISGIEKIGRTQADTESDPVEGYTGVFTRVAAGNAKSTDGTHKVAYGITADQVHEGDEQIVPSTGVRSVVYLGIKGVKTLKHLMALFTTFVAYAEANMGMNTASAVIYVVERFNHAFNIEQRKPFRPDISGATGSKAATDIIREGIRSGLDPALLEEKAAALIAELLKAQTEAAEKVA